MSHQHFTPAVGLHELVTVVRAPSVCLSGGDGQISAGGAQGFYDSDRRILSRLQVEVADATVIPVGRSHGGGEAVFSSQVWPDGDASSDASVSLHRRRTVRPGGLTERLEFVNRGTGPVGVRLLVRCGSDLAPMGRVRAGADYVPVASEADGSWVRWSDGGQEVVLTADREPEEIRCEDGGAVVAFRVVISAESTWSVTLSASPSGTERAGADRSALFGQAPTGGPPVFRASAQPRDPVLAKLVGHSLEDLDGMLLTDPFDPADLFLAAGSPWYFTLFGRDALWSAALLLPLGTRLAAGTLRTLARRQGTRLRPQRDEQPGKILHEVRRETLRVADVVIPPVYYGTIDATALWVRLLHDAWRSGMPADEVAALLPHLQAALRWITEYGDADGDGLLEYRSSAHDGLANQGWKDSAEGVRWADGRFAEAPLALCEVQAYAYAAAVQGADMLDAFGLSIADHWREWAARLRECFRRSYWLSDAYGPYPAIALDGGKRPVDGATSNMAHVLGTGLLTSEESALVANRLAQPDLDCGYGLRTLSETSRAFNPLSYHCGSVWPHDTAIAVLGLAAEGHHTVACSLAQGVVAAAEHFEYRLPELYGVPGGDGGLLLAYPTACRPQAWAAAGAVAIAGYLEGRASYGVDARRTTPPEDGLRSTR
ncbi:glycogen debranching N-terminal domain-containing protein [Streptomyces sp. AK02-04a]|uniref:glycogen debranching N-terminal domain-containing protein n=1 Tax=Streptomyces sp. AK02-04a TaxID=3028649 RepID=UPI0029A74BF2|nr:glycogen debranching N-terminal domain-containing protein [Streptomyces sp. AK02-04a]MDX3762287.1 glycogen debranching N-terminal domain-containing protein [Streptomyces sp. AK02-04a]